jgi:hypothetical protein
MKQILLIFTTALLLVSCTQNPNPAFDKNVDLAKTWFSAFEAEDMEAISEMFAEEVEYQGAFYGMELMNTKQKCWPIWADGMLLWMILRIRPKTFCRV